MSEQPLSILVLCPHYEPDTAPTGEVMTSICEQWTARGHRVEIITSLPWYRDHAVAEGWKGRLVRTQQEPWGRIRRWHPFPSNKRRLMARAAGFAGFTALAGIDAAIAAGRCDVVFAMSPPIT
ncbi:MAG: glycosyltransferase family 4 protein, partial [Acidimicrobiia bacterium]|nr:glycosyltransferase family 4 protein [Acidimicrobiia bacterium]